MLIWSLVALYLLFILLTHLSVIQGLIGSYASSLLSEKLQTEVKVGNVNLGFLNRVIIDDVAVKDLDGEKLMKVGRLSTRIDILPLMQGRISISSIQLFGANIHLSRANADSELNCQFIIDALASKDTTSQSPLDLCINSVIIRHSSVSYDQEDAPVTSHFDHRHLGVENISAHLILKTLTDDSLNVNVKRLAFQEKSGLDVRRIALKLTVGRRNAELSHFTIELPHSELTIPHAHATYQYEQLKETLSYEVEELKSMLTPRDFACFHAPLKQLGQQIVLQTAVTGTGTSIQIPKITLDSSDNHLIFRGNAWAEHLDKQHPKWYANISHLNIDGQLTRNVQKAIEEIPAFLGNIDHINLTGTYEGQENGDLSLYCSLNSNVGDIKALFLKRGDSQPSYTARIETQELNLQEILKADELGLTSAHLTLSGTASEADVKGTLQRFDYNDYTYQDIQLDGKVIAQDLFKGLDQRIQAQGLLAVDDPNIRTQLEGSCLKNGQHLTVQLKGEVANLSLRSLHLSDNWGDAIFSGTIQSDFKASNLNDAEGSVTIADFLMKDSLYQYAIHQLRLESGYQEGKHFLQLDGDMGTAALIGQFDWKTLPQSIYNFVGSRLPTLPGLPKNKKAVHNDFDIQVNLNNTDWMQHLLHIPFLIYRPLTINANINDNSQIVNVDGNIPSFTYNGESYHDAQLHIDTPQDTIVCEASVTKVMEDDSRMDLNLQAHAYDNQLTTYIRWDNHAEDHYKKLSGELNMLTQLYTDDQDRPEAYLHIEPSHTIINGAKWDVIPSDIFYTDKNLSIDQFSIRHEKQHLNIQGKASSLASDTLTVDLKDVDVEYVLDLVNFDAVKFEGLATGKASLIQPFDSLAAHADLTVRDFRFENGRMGTLNARALWNQEDKQIDIHAIALDEPNVRTLINGYVSPVREDIFLDIQAQGTYLDFTRTYTSSFLDQLTGHANGNVQLVGPLGAMDLLGKLVVDGHARVKPLGTTYTLMKDTLYLVKNDILLSKAEIQDKYHHKAFISGGIHHENLSNLTFDLDIETSRLLAYDFADYGNEVFCGHILAGGKVDLHGRPGEVIINCDVTPMRSSVFYYNAASADAVSNQDFITWNEKKTDTLSNVVAGKKEEEVTADFPSDLYLNFLINTTPEANLRLLMDERTQDYISLFGSGVIRASYHNKGAFTMYGTYEVDHGTYGLTIQNIIKKNFQFNEGSTIVFGGNPMNAALNLQAVHTVNGVSLSDLNIGESFSNNTIRVNCLMNILGQAGSPRVEFDLDMPNVNSEEKQMIRSIISSEEEMNQQVIYLLGIGRFYTQGINNADQNATQEYGQTQLAMQSFLSGTLSSQINELISDVVKNENWNFGANISTGNEGWHNAEYEGLISGRLFNNRLLINGQFGYRDNARQATPSFIGDFDIRYLLQPNGNLALKMYNQTNDRYFTKSSLNTQGIGIIIKKDFSNIGELFKKVKK